MNSCKNCNESINGNYCSNCGQPVILKKIDRAYVIHEIKDALFSDRGFFYTTKQLFLRPGASVRHYITEDRSRYVKPVTYLIITALIYTLASHFFNIDFLTHFEIFEIQDTPAPTMNRINRWMMDNMGYSGLITELYMAFWIRLFFRKSDYNLYEIFILLCYVSGIQLLFHSMALIPQAFIYSDSLNVSACIATIYSFWAIGQFFDGKKTKNYLKAILSFIVGSLIIVLISMIGSIVEVLIRQ